MCYRCVCDCSDGRNGINEENGTDSDSGTSADMDEESILYSPPSTVSIPESKTAFDAVISKCPEIGNEKLEKRKQDVSTTTSSLLPRGDVFEQPIPLAETNGLDDHSSGRGSAVFHILQENIPLFQPNIAKMPEIRHLYKLPLNYTLPAPPLPVPETVLPCMRGTLREDVENRRHVCTGIWGMSMADTDRGTTVRRVFFFL